MPAPPGLEAELIDKDDFDAILDLVNKMKKDTVSDAEMKKINLILKIVLFNINPNPLKLISIVLISGVISGFILTLLTIIIIYAVFKSFL